MTNSDHEEHMTTRFWPTFEVLTCCPQLTSLRDEMWQHSQGSSVHFALHSPSAQVFALWELLWRLSIWTVLFLSLLVCFSFEEAEKQLEAIDDYHYRILSQKWSSATLFFSLKFIHDRGRQGILRAFCHAWNYTFNDTSRCCTQTVIRTDKGSS